MLDGFRTRFETRAEQLAATKNERSEQAPYCRSIARFLDSVQERTVLDDTDRDRLFGFVYQAWNEFRTDVDLARTFGPEHSRTAENGHNFVSSLLAQAFDQARDPERAAWIRSVQGRFLPYFVSRYIQDSMFEVMANDRAPELLASTVVASASGDIFISLPFSPVAADLPRHANELGSNSAEMLLELSRMCRATLWKATNPETRTIILAQQKILTSFIVTLGTRLNYDSPKPQEDYDLICRFFEEELEEIVTDVRVAMQAEDLVPTMVGTTTQMLSKLCNAAHMLRYECWTKECETKIMAYLKQKYVQAS